MNIKHALAAAALLFCFYAPAVAQEERPLDVRINDSIREHEPEWLLTRGQPTTYHESCKCETVFAVWAKGGARIFYVVYQHKSEGVARAAYKSLMEWYKFSDAEASDESHLGEISYSYFDLDGPGQWYPNVGSKVSVHLLRRKREVVMVIGDTPKLVKRFSELIAAQLPAP